MALINCTECNHEVSDKAAACPKCGAPIASARETAAAGTTLNTVQKTSKKFKLQSAFSTILIIVGIVWVFNSSQSEQTETGYPGLMLVVGLVWFIVNRLRIWWHHD